MKKVIVGFSSHSGLFSAAIRFVTRSKVSHVYIKIPVPEYGEHMVFQASGLVVNYTNYSLFLEKSIVGEEYEIQVDDDVAAVGEKMRVTEAGKPYSMKEIFGLLWVLALRGLGINVSNPLRDGSQSFICVELAMLCVGLDKESENTTPEEFRLWCQRNGRLIKNPT